MKTITISLKKKVIYDFVDASTYKRTDATLDQSSQRVQNAASSDQEDDNDSLLIKEYCDLRDARLRARLKFCIIDDSETENLVYDNTPTTEEDEYTYKLRVEDEFNVNDLKSVGKRMDSYIKRGAIFSWYLGAGLEAVDSEKALEEVENDIVSILRGQAWGRRPMQPFGPAFFNYKKPVF